MTSEILTRHVVHPWLADAMGHLTTRHYMAFFDDASYHLLALASGWSPGDAAWTGFGWADVKQTIEYRSEVHVGTLLEVRGALSRLGRSSVDFALELVKCNSGDIAATYQSKTVFFNLETRRAAPLTEAMRESMNLMMSAQSTQVVVEQGAMATLDPPAPIPKRCNH